MSIEVLPWHDKIHAMCKEYCAFSIAAQQKWPESCFANFGQLGKIAVSDEVVGAYLCFLRFKNGPRTSTNVRKLTTIRNLWWQTKAGVRQALRGSDLPNFCKPRSPEVSMVVNRLFATWHKIDIASAEPKQYLLESEIEAYCLHVIWQDMCSSEGDFNPVRLLHALVLRVQSGCGARCCREYKITMCL